MSLLSWMAPTQCCVLHQDRLLDTTVTIGIPEVKQVKSIYRVLGARHFLNVTFTILSSDYPIDKDDF